MSKDNESRPKLLDLAGAEDYTGIPLRYWKDWAARKRIPFTQPAGKGGTVFVSTEYLDRVMDNAVTVKEES